MKCSDKRQLEEHHKADTVLAAALVAGDDDLARERVACAGDGVVHDADGTHDLAGLLDLVHEVRRVANHDLRLRGEGCV